MAEGFKTMLAMIIAHAAGAHAAERKMRVGNMHNRVVHAAAAK